MSKYIKATTAAEIISEKLGVRLSDMVDIMFAVPEEDVEPVVHGYWNRVDMSFRAYMCSCCDNMATFRFDYCPNCGAKMDGEAE